MKKKSRKGIKITKRSPQWRRELTDVWKSFVKNAWNMLGGVGLITVIVLIARWL